jgi:hypothetical protein
VEKAGPGNVGHRGPNLLAGMDHIDPKCVDGVAADIVTVDSRYQDLAFVVVHKEPTNHLFGLWLRLFCNGERKEIYNQLVIGRRNAHSRDLLSERPYCVYIEH